MSKRRWLVVAVLLAACVAVLLLLMSDRETSATGEPDRARQVRRATAARIAGAVDKSAASLDWLIEPGVAPRRIAGRVVAGERPVPGAKVELRSPLFHFRSTRPPVRTTDSRGHFDFGEQPVTAYFVMASKQGYAPEGMPVEPGNPNNDTSSLEIVLSECDRAEFGTVENTNGSPLGSATVVFATFVGVHIVPIFETHTDNNGHFAICRPALAYVHVEAKGHGSVMLGRTMPIGGWRVVLFPEAVVEGRVLDQADNPVAGVIIEVFPKAILVGAMSPLSQSATTDSSGAFRISGLTARTYALTPRRGRFAPGGTTVTLRPGDVRKNVVLRMLSGCRTVAGIVLEGEASVAGAKVYAGGDLYTQSDGSFVIQCAPSLAFDIEVPGFEVAGGTVPEGENDVDDLVVRVTGRASISGRVLAGNDPVANAVVTFRTKSSNPGFQYQPGERFRASTDKEGRYVIRGVPPGTHDLIVRDAPGKRRAPSQSVVIKKRQAVTEVNFSLTDTKSVHGVVVDPDGRPIEAVSVRLRGSSIPKEVSYDSGPFRQATTAKGEFTFTGLGAGQYELCVESSCKDGGDDPLYGTLSGEKTAVAIIEADDRVDVRIVVRGHTGQSITGHVRYDTGAPAVLATVNTYRRTAITDKAGSFALHGLMDQEHRLRVRGTDGSTTKTDGVRAGSVIDIVLPRAATIAGRVIGGDGRCTTTNGPARFMDSNGRTAETRTFLFEGLSPGEHTVRTSCHPTGMASVTVELAAGETRNVTLTVGKASSIRGRVLTFFEDQPVPGAQCSTMSARSYGIQTSDENGYFLVSEVFPGDGLILCGTASTTGLGGIAFVRITAGDEVKATVYVVKVAPDMAQRETLGAKLTESALELVFSDVEAGKTAARAGVQDGDILLAVGSADARGVKSQAAKFYLESRAAGTRVPITVRRGGSPVSLTLAYTKQP